MKAPPAEERARALFAGIAARYEGPAELLSFGQYGRWRRALVRALPARPASRVLDVATGTGLIAREIERVHGCSVVGVDLTAEMLGLRPAVQASADGLPFPSEGFDVVVFSYLLRYVQDPAATLRELARVLRPGGTLASVEFGLPAHPIARAGWRAYAHRVFPLVVRTFGAGWREVGAFLPGSIEDWAGAWPIERQVGAWRAAGLTGIRVRRMTLGAGVLTMGVKGA